MERKAISIPCFPFQRLYYYVPCCLSLPDQHFVAVSLEL